MVEETSKSNDKRVCCGCGRNKTADNGKGVPIWHLNKPTNLVLCHVCYFKYIRPEIKKHWSITRRKIPWEGGERVLFKDKRYCYACGKSNSTLDLRDNTERWFANPIGLHKLTSWYHYVGKEILWLCYPCYIAIYLSRFAVFSLINKYSCERCGQNDLLCLELDHINGGGNYYRTKFGGGKNMYRFYIKNPEIAKSELQVLCANCNKRKWYINNEINRKYVPLE